MYEHFFKRLIDIILSALGLILLSWLYLILAIAIVIDDPGPVFFSQKRIGIHKTHFQLHKFRSMKMNAADIRNSDGSTYNSDTDDRQTKVGKVLRKTSLDELPQCINVLAGDMSFVGPRPSPMGNEATYTKFIKKKFRVRPGITGLNQALKRNSATMEERYKNDVYYAEHVSLLLDIKIILMTVKSVLLRKNIYRK